MIDLLKLVGKGFIYLFLIPLGICFFAIYGIYLFLVCIYMLFRKIVLILKKEPSGLTLKEDIKAKQILNSARDFGEPQETKQGQGVNLILNIDGQQLKTMNNEEKQKQDYIDVEPSAAIEERKEEDK